MRILHLIPLLLFCIFSFAQKPEVVLTTGHTDMVNCMDMNHTGTLLATGGNDKNVKIWDVASGKEVWTFSGNDGRIQFVKFSPDGKFLAAMNYSEQIKVYELASGNMIAMITEVSTNDPMHFMNNRTLMYMGADSKLKTFDFITNKALTENYFWWMYRFIPSVDRQSVYSLTVDGKLKRYSLDGVQKDSVVLFEQGTMLPITPLELSKDGKYIAVALYDLSLKVFNAETLDEVAHFKGMSLAIYDIIFKESDPDVLLCVDASKAIRAFSVSQKKEILKISNMLFGAMCLEVHPTQDYYLANEMKMVHFCRMSDGAIVKTYKSIMNRVMNLAYDQQGKYVATASDDITLKIWDLRENKIAKVLPGYFPVCFTNDGTKLLSSFMGTSIAVWDPETGERKQTLATEGELMQNLSVSADGYWAAGGGYTGVLKVWNLTNGKLEKRLSGHVGGIYGTSFSPDGKFLASCGMDLTVRIWDLQSGKEIKKIESAHEIIASDIKFSPDGKLLATAGWDKKIKLWSCSDWSLSKTLEGHLNIITTIAFNGDGTRLISGSGNNVVSPADNTIRVWDVQAGKELCKMFNPTGQINKVEVELKGDQLFSCSEDGMMKIWNYKNCTEIAGYIAANKTEHLIMTPDNYYMCSRSALAAVSFRVNGQVYPFEQFDVQLNRPDIVSQRTGRTPQSLINAYQYVHNKRLKKLGFSQQSSDFHLPEIVLMDRGIPLITKESKYTFKLKLTDTKYKLDRLQVYINDVPVYGMNGIALKNKVNGSLEENIEIDLTAGRNKIQFSCFNEKGAESLAETVELMRESGEKVNGNLYVVSFGVSNYKDNRFNLKYAAKDAEDIVSSFGQATALYKNIYTKTFKDAEVTKENFESIKDFLKNTGVDDVVLVFVAGHGVLDDKFDYYFCTSDISFDDPAARGLSFESIESAFNGIKAVRKLLFMDTCHSGELDKDEVEKSKVQEEGAVAFRAVGEGVRKKEGFGLENSLQLMETLFSNTKKGTGTTVISSAGGAEFAMESDEWKNGLFTYCLLKGLKEKSADKNGNGEILLSELQQYVKQQVTELSKGRQVPTARTENLTLDYRLW